MLRIRPVGSIGASALNALGVALLALLASACGGNEAPAGPRPLDPGLTWQWQLQGALNTDYDVDLYDTLGGQIATLRADDRLVLCYFSAGSGENWRPDFADFPAAVLGEPLDGWEGERWLDIRAETVLDVLRARLDQAQAKGCDGVEPDNVNAWENETGFPVDEADQIRFNRWLAGEAHERGLFIALKNAGALAADLVGDFDLALNEECIALGECEEFRPFLDAGKPVLNAEYAPDEVAANGIAGAVCAQAREFGLRTLILPLALDDGFRLSCDSR